MHDALVFVYGTLQPGQRYWDRISNLVASHHPAELAGFSLWHLSAGYPAIVPGAGVVRGTLLTWKPGVIERAWEICDEIEGWDPGDPESEYQRRTVRVTHWALGMPRSERAQTYVYHPNRRDALVVTGAPLPGGDWLAFWQNDH